MDTSVTRAVFEHVFSSSELTAELLATEQHILLFGEQGIGKSTLACQLMEQHQNVGKQYSCLAGDPGFPAFGIPGALSLVQWHKGAGLKKSYQALCSLDAGRFRLPLVASVRKLAAKVTTGSLIVDAPGVARGVAGAELLLALIDAAGIDCVVVMLREGESPPLINELLCCQAELVQVTAHASARRLTKQERCLKRSQMWQAYLAHADNRTLHLDDFQLLGTPPPLNAPESWAGKQIALLYKGAVKTMGEVLCLDDDALHVSLGASIGDVPGEENQLLIRDAIHSKGRLQTAIPYKASANKEKEKDHFSLEKVIYDLPNSDNVITKGDGTPSKRGESGIVARVGHVAATLVNGVLGDPLLHLQLLYRRRSLLFDLGDPGRISARVAHQVTDVFITHTHADHIGGFLWLLRSRIGTYPPCRFYGPPGLVEQIAGMVKGILWDRVEDRAPRFEVRELHGNRMRRWLVTAGKKNRDILEELPVNNDVVWQEPSFCVRATVLDHGTPVLAYSFEPAMQIKVRQDQLSAHGLKSGQWLQELKQLYMDNKLEAKIRLPDGKNRTVKQLADQFLLLAPGNKLAYATDFADTPDNCEKLVSLVNNAHTFFCEASFIVADRERARSTQHLTTAACGKIACAANVEHLIPFHFSRRYAKNLKQVYRELTSACPNTRVPHWFFINNYATTDL